MEGSVMEFGQEGRLARELDNNAELRGKSAVFVPQAAESCMIPLHISTPAHPATSPSYGTVPTIENMSVKERGNFSIV